MALGGGVDFLKQDTPFNGDIITNPPYKYALEFCRKAIMLSKRKVAMFLKIQFLETKKRYVNLFKDYPPSRVYVFVKRVNCYPNNDKTKYGSAVCYAWFIWDKLYSGEPRIRWIQNF